MSINGQAPTIHPGEVVDLRRLVIPHAPPSGAARHFFWHKHFRAQLVYASEGVLTVATAGGTWVVPPQQAVWVPAGTLHEVTTQGLASMRFLYLHPQAAAGLSPSCYVLAVSELLRALILRTLDFPKNYGPDGPEARIVEVILDELRASRPEPLHLPMPDDPRLKVITAALIEQPALDGTLGQWARRAGASERTLARLFLKETGMTFGAWRQRLRLLTAVARLGEGAPVTSVAYDLGYDSPSAFIAMFRKNLGRTPGRYFAPADA